MTQHPITPPEELVASMIEQAFNPLGATGLSDADQLTGAFADLVTRAVQWGADQELEACCELVRNNDGYDAALALRADRRPKPSSLKRVALLQLDVLNADLGLEDKGIDLSQIRRALEQLDD